MFIAIITPEDTSKSVSAIGPFESEGEARMCAIAAYIDNLSRATVVDWEVTSLVTTKEYADSIGV